MTKILMDYSTIDVDVNQKAYLNNYSMYLLELKKIEMLLNRNSIETTPTDTKYLELIIKPLKKRFRVNKYPIVKKEN